MAKKSGLCKYYAKRRFLDSLSTNDFLQSLAYSPYCLTYVEYLSKIRFYKNRKRWLKTWKRWTN